MIRPTTIGKHKVPRYIYHLTTQRKYNSIMETGTLNKSNDQLCGDGVFLFELINFFKNWRRNKDWENDNLQESLIQHVRSYSDGLVLLKIPTHSLNINKLNVRSQNRLFRWLQTHNREIVRINCSRNLNPAVQLYNLLLNTAEEQTVIHLTQGSSAKKSSLFEKRKEAIEYIYYDNIPTCMIEKIGEITQQLLHTIMRSNSETRIQDIFSVLLKDKSEIQSIKALK